MNPMNPMNQASQVSQASQGSLKFAECTAAHFGKVVLVFGEYDESLPRAHSLRSDRWLPSSGAEPQALRQGQL